MQARFYTKRKTMTDDQKILIKYVYKDLNEKINIVIGAINAIAGKAASDAKDLLFKRKDLWKHTVKYNARLCISDIEQNEHNFVTERGQKYDAFLDYLDAVEELFQKHVDILGYSIQQVLTKNNVEDAPLKSKCELARTLLEYACYCFDRLMYYANKETGIDFAQIYKEKRLTKAYFHWCNVCMVVDKTQGDENVQLNSDPNCRLAFTIIEKLFMSEELLNKAGLKAMELNPGIITSQH